MTLISQGPAAERLVAVRGVSAPRDGDAVRTGADSQVQEGICGPEAGRPRGTAGRHLWALTEGSRGFIGTPELHELLSSDLLKLKGEALKRYEDTLDALFCAYLAWHCWRWGAARNEMFGTLENGYIVVPTGIGHAGAG